MSRLDDDIKAGTYAKVYLLYGDEAYLKSFYKYKLRSALIGEGDEINLNTFQGTSISEEEVISQAQTMPFFAEHRLIIVEGSGWFKKGGQMMADALPALPEETVLLFIEDEVDARGKLYKAVKKDGVLMEVKTLTGDALTRWILIGFKRAGKKITGSAMQLLLDNAGTNMQNLRNEMDKLIAYTGDREGIVVEDVQAVTTVQIENKIFKMIDAIASKEQVKAIVLYRDLLALREPPMRILSLLIRQFNQILEVKELRVQGFDQSTIAQRTGLRDFMVRGALRHSEMFTLSELRTVLERCARADEDIKTGRMKDKMAVELVLVAASGK